MPLHSILLTSACFLRLHAFSEIACIDCEVAIDTIIRPAIVMISKFWNVWRHGQVDERRAIAHVHDLVQGSCEALYAHCIAL